MRLISLLMTLLVGWAAAAAAQEAGITVRGQGRVEVAPDMATLTLGVTSEAGTAQEAMARNSEVMSDVLSRLEEAGISERDIQTSGLSLFPVHEQRSPEQRPEIAGYQANNLVTVRVRDLDALGEVLDAAVADGANTINGLTFGVQDREALQDRALTEAVEDATGSARQIAEAAGVSLGAVRSVTEESGAWRPVQMMEARMSSDAVPIAEGEVTVEASVTMVFEIED